MTFAVRQLVRADAFLAAYRSLRIQLWPDCRDDCDRDIAQILAAPDRWATFILLQNADTAIGFIEVHLREYAEGSSNSPVPFVEGWFVAPEQRGQGLGRTLMKAAENWAVSRGCHELASDTELSNRLSIEVHGRLGFEEVERLVCFLKRLTP